MERRNADLASDLKIKTSSRVELGRVSLVLPACHLGLCLATRVGLLASEGSWAWFLVFVIDFPISVLLLPLLNITDPLLVFGLLGTAWWFLISKLALYAVKRAIHYKPSR